MLVHWISWVDAFPAASALPRAPLLGCAGQVRHAAGEGLVLAMRQVPPVFFTEDFSLARRASSGRTFHATNAMSRLPQHARKHCCPWELNDEL